VFVSGLPGLLGLPVDRHVLLCTRVLWSAACLPTVGAWCVLNILLSRRRPPSGAELVSRL